MRRSTAANELFSTVMSTRPKPKRQTKGCDWSLADLPGLDAETRSHLAVLEIHTTQQLLQRASTPRAKQELANYLRLNSKSIDKWVAMSDLARLPAVGIQNCGLLLHAGIASVAQLAQTPPSRLHQQLLRLQVATLRRRDLCPGVENLQQWVQQARLATPVRRAQSQSSNENPHPRR